MLFCSGRRGSAWIRCEVSPPLGTFLSSLWGPTSQAKEHSLGDQAGLWLLWGRARPNAEGREKGQQWQPGRRASPRNSPEV